MGAGAAPEDDRAIVRLMLFIRRPYHLSEQEGEAWMRGQAVPLAQAATVESVEVSRLHGPGSQGGRDWDWLIEMHCADAEAARQAARAEACRDLVADLRLLGMQPRLVLADATRPLES
jgi:hypothetical protein